MNNEVDHKEIQKVILSIFKEFKRICEKHNLTYYAIGGTCIGAVRHKGFIPWDDDLDVAMPLPDYYKFIKYAKKELNANMQLYECFNNKDNGLTFFKIHDIRTTFIEEYLTDRPDGYRGVYIDIMPISGITKNKIISKMFINRLVYYGSLNIFLKKYNKNSNRYLDILKGLITRKKDQDYYLRKYYRLIEKYPICRKNDIFFTWRIHLHAHYHNIFRYELFEKAVEVPFEDTTIMLPVGYDEYLKEDFGDYMKLPPKNKRTTFHKTSIVDLKHSYTIYADKKRKELENVTKR